MVKSSVDPIPFNRPSLDTAERAHLEAAIAAGHYSGDGPCTKRAHALLQESLEVHRAFLTTSCTHALEMSALLLDVQPGDEVIVPSFTFVSTVNAFVLRGAIPVFADVRGDTLNLDERALPGLITPRTKVIVPVHYAGVGCEMDAILATAAQHGIAVVEDNAQGIFGRYRGKPLGSFGPLAALSFHETKNFSCGEGGALLVNDPRYAERAEIIREKGTDRSRFFRGQVDKYGWVDVGSSFLPSELLAAILLGQLESRERIIARRRAIWSRYDEALKDWARQRGVGQPFVPAHVDQSYHMYYLLAPDLERRTDLISHLKARGIASVFHYLPLNASPMGQRFGARAGQCPVTESVSDRLLRLPFFNSMTDSQQERVIDALLEWG
jgi:dTDP-4-amino-4,6-dideoxygalactose transaminase